MRKLITICLALLMASAGFAQVKKWTLQECVQYAIDNNITIQQTALDQETADLERKDAIGALLPSLNGNASNNFISGLTQNVTTGILENQTTRNSSYSLNAGITLFDGLRNFKRLSRAKLSKIAAQYNISQIKDNVSLNVANAFLTVLLNKQQLEVVKTQNALTKEQIARTEQLVEGGVLPRNDLLEIKATDASEQQRIIVAENNITISLISLAQLLSFDDYKNFDIVDADYNVLGEEMLDITAEELIAKAKETRFEIKVAEQSEAIAQKDLEISKGAYFPTLSFGVNYNTRESGFQPVVPVIDPNNPFVLGDNPIGQTASGESIFGFQQNIIGFEELNPDPFFTQLYTNDGLGYGFSLQVPIFNGFSTRNNVKRNKVALKRAQFQTEQTRLNLETAVYQATTDARAAKESYAAAQVAVEAQELAFAYAKDRYDIGAINAFDFSQSKQRYDNAQLELNRSKYDYIFRIKILELYFGIPATELKF